MPMVIVIHMNIAIPTAVIIEFGIDQKQRFLTKINKIMFDIQQKRHTHAI